MSTDDADARWVRIDQLLSAALDQPPELRDTFVERESAGDTTLRDAVLRLLRAAEAPSPLDEDSASLRDALLRDVVRDWDEHPPDVPVIPRYRIERALGRGGMGTVYLGTRDDGVVAQQVAIKVLRRGVDTEDVLGRFQRERQILASFDHPNISRMLDGGATVDGRPYLIMEYVDGVDIVDWCNERALPAARRLHIFTQLCDAVEYAHQRLVVHRDIKPSNILMDASGVPKLLDFGIAKLIGSDVENSLPDALSPQLLTRTGHVYATPRYASPEQLRGEQITTATDVFQLGVLLYELLTGAHPTGTASAQFDTMRSAILGGDIIAPSRLPGRAALRGDLDAIVLKTLRPNSADRYASVAALRSDIERHLRGEAVEARIGAMGYRIRRTMWRRRRSLAAAAVGLLVAGAYVVNLKSHATALEAERNRAELAAAQAEQTTSFLVDLFRAPADELVARGDTISARTLLTRGAERVQVELAEQPAVRAALLQAMGTAAHHLFLDNTGQLFDAEIDALRQAYGERDIRVVRALQQQAGRYAQNRSFAYAVLRYRAALSLTDGLTPDSLVLALKSGLGNALVFAEQPDSAEVVLREALEALEGPRNTNPQLLATVQQSLAAVERRQGNVIAAESLLVASIRNAPSDTIRLSGLNNLAALVRQQQRSAEAENLYREAVTLARSYEPATDRGRNLVAMNLASFLLGEKRYEEALIVLQEELTSHRASFPPTHWRIGSVLGAIAQTLHTSERYEESLRYRDEQLSVYRASLSEDNNFTVRALADRGSTLAAAGRVGEAERDLLAAERSADAQENAADRTSLLRLVRGKLQAMYEASGRPALARRYPNPS